MQEIHTLIDMWNVCQDGDSQAEFKVAGNVVISLLLKRTITCYSPSA